MLTLYIRILLRCTDPWTLNVSKIFLTLTVLIICSFWSNKMLDSRSRNIKWQMWVVQKQTELRDQHASNSSSSNNSSSSIQHPASLNNAYKNTLATLFLIPWLVGVRLWSISSPEERNGESRGWSFDCNEKSSDKKNRNSEWHFA